MGQVGVVRQISQKYQKTICRKWVQRRVYCFGIYEFTGDIRITVLKWFGLQCIKHIRWITAIGLTSGTILTLCVSYVYSQELFCVMLGLLAMISLVIGAVSFIELLCYGPAWAKKKLAGLNKSP